jgi:hypothetical protein
MGRSEAPEPRTKLEIAKSVLFSIFVAILWLAIGGIAWWTFEFARKNIKIVDDLP